MIGYIFNNKTLKCALLTFGAVIILMGIKPKRYTYNANPPSWEPFEGKKSNDLPHLDRTIKPSIKQNRIITAFYVKQSLKLKFWLQIPKRLLTTHKSHTSLTLNVSTFRKRTFPTHTYRYTVQYHFSISQHFPPISKKQLISKMLCTQETDIENIRIDDDFALQQATESFSDILQEFSKSLNLDSLDLKPDFTKFKLILTQGIDPLSLVSKAQHPKMKELAIINEFNEITLDVPHEEVNEFEKILNEWRQDGVLVTFFNIPSPSELNETDAAGKTMRSNQLG